MGFLLKISKAIDWLNDSLGWIANWLVLAACLISAGNAMSRYAFDLSSNAWLEIQWYLFAAIVMFGASHTLRKNEHVRVDILYTHMSERGKEWLDLIGTRKVGAARVVCGLLAAVGLAVMVGIWTLVANVPRGAY